MSAELRLIAAQLTAGALAAAHVPAMSNPPSRADRAKGIVNLYDAVLAELRERYGTEITIERAKAGC